MATAQVLMRVGVLIVSFIIGLIFFYVIHPDEKEIKKQQLEEVSSQLINFVIFIWIGKVIFHLKLFVQDPLAVLAYPSDANAFYIATILFLLMISYRIFRKKMDLSMFMTSFIPILLATSLVYEFIQMIVNGTNAFLYLALLMVLLILYITVLNKKAATDQLLLLGAWAVGLFTLSFVLPFVTLFGYIISRFFFIGVLVLCLALFSYNNWKKVS